MQYQRPLTRTREMFSRAVGLVRMRNLNRLNLSRALRDPECMVGDVKETRAKDRESRSPQEPLAIACMAIRVHHNTTRVLVIGRVARCIAQKSLENGRSALRRGLSERNNKNRVQSELAKLAHAWKCA